MIDLWIIDKFNILPTDERFVNLYDEQKIALFEGVCSLPDQQSLKKNLMITKEIEKIEKKDDFSFLPKGTRKRLEENYKNSGYSNEAIQRKFREIVNIKRKEELKKWEELRNGGQVKF
jgi:hypothetical protein